MFSTFLWWCVSLWSLFTMILSGSWSMSDVHSWIQLSQSSPALAAWRENSSPKRPCVVDTSQIATISLTPSCFQTGTINFDRMKYMDVIWPHITQFTGLYDTVRTGFVYTGGQIQLSGTQDIGWLYGTGRDVRIWLGMIDRLGGKITLSSSDWMAYRLHHQATVYIADRDIHNYGPCSTHNFNLAFDAFGTVILAPWSWYNINRVLANATGYCVGDDENTRKYLFYQWVCGFATQLFRQWLINPFIAITKRAPHTQRYSKYYSGYIYGDDAAIYEYDKQLEIKNIWLHPLYMRTKLLDGRHYLISIIPERTDQYSQIFKYQTDTLSARVGKRIFSNTGLLYTQDWTNTYSAINTQQN